MNSSHSATSGLPRVIKKEIVVVATAGGVLNVLGDNFEAVPQVSDRVVAAYWHDNEGSVGQHLVRATSTDPVRAVSRFRQSVD